MVQREEYGRYVESGEKVMDITSNPEDFPVPIPISISFEWSEAELFLKSPTIP